ncbi:MAG: hypothetical protein GY906_30805, partial [bacterium]|nr:hypothetical protein [bacterium]
FSYDPVGNRAEQVVDEGGGPTTIASTYDDRDRLLTAGATSYGWDANGNLTSREGSAYEWDSENRLTSVTLDDGTLVQTTYDADGNRVSTEVMPPGEPTTAVNYLVDTTGFLSHVVAEVVSGSMQTLYTRANDQLIALLRPASEAQRYFHADGLGSVRVLSDEAGTVTDLYQFEAFGALLKHVGDDPNTYLFAGEPLDPNIGFAYHRARWVDQRVGRFVSLDPWAGSEWEPMTLHRYTYAASEPVTRVDPSGLAFSVGQVVTALAVGLTFVNIGLALARGDRRGAVKEAAIGLLAIFGPLAAIRLINWARTWFISLRGATSLVRSGDAALEAAASAERLLGPEVAQGFRIFGLKGMSGSTFIRSIVLIEAERKGAVSLFRLVKFLETEARLNGARELLIVGHAVINQTLLR